MKLNLLTLIFLVWMPSVCLATNYTQYPSCVGAWSAEEGTGTTTDDVSSGSSVGTFKAISLPVWYNTSTPDIWSTWAVDFDNTTDNIGFGDVTILDGATSASWSLWVRLDTNSNGRIIAKWGNATNEQCFDIEIVDTDEILYANGTSLGANQIKKTNNANLNTGVWHHIVCEFTAPNTVAIYVDGNSKSLTTILNENVSAIQNTATPLEFGYETDEATSAFDGQLDDVAFFKDYILSSTEINDIMDNGLTGATTTRRLITVTEE